MSIGNFMGKKTHFRTHDKLNMYRKTRFPIHDTI